ncbi:MAG: hypothetical protein JOY79_02780 [Acidobacteriaceae bacterium]|nr:hypothetical protein [Acidobacteriaceae bacterium]
MRAHLGLILLLVASAAPCANAAGFAPGPYGGKDGALMLLSGGDLVEPYFATKALLVAQDVGLDVGDAAQGWVKWLMARQLSDGRFNRYCRSTSGEWRACGAADADDSMLAMWLQLLYRLAPDSGLPAQWQQSAARADMHLRSLRNARLGVYHISHRNHVALFMDNVEVYAALRDVADAEQRFGASEKSAQTRAQADDLGRAMLRIFWNRRTRWFRVSTQKQQHGDFYPDAVAQAFPILAHMDLNDRDPHAVWEWWRKSFGEEWLDRKRDPHPWGLLAIAAFESGDRETAACWLSQSQPFRYSKDWNVLEEASYQALQASLSGQEHPSACSGVIARR